MSTQSSHPSPEALRGYQERTLPPVELLAVDDHLAGCAECRDKTASPGAAARAFRALCPADEPVHLLDETLTDYLSGSLPSAEALRVAAHLEQCRECEEEAEALRVFRKQLAELPARPFVAVVQGGGAARSLEETRSGVNQFFSFLLQPAVLFPTQAVGVAALVAVLIHQTQVKPLRAGLGQEQAALRQVQSEVESLRRQNEDLRTRPDAQVLADAQAQAARLRERLSSQSQEYQARLAREEQLRKAAERRSEGEVVALESGGERILLDRDGKGYRVTAAEPLPQMAVNALRNQEVEAFLPPEFLQEAPTTRGGETPFTLRAPLTTRVRSRQPSFEWEKMRDATRYELILIDETNGTKLEYGNIPGPPWTPPAPLTPGHRYQWEVRAYNGPEITGAAPREPAPVARFQVMDEKQLADLEAELKKQGDSPLLRGLTLARAGLLMEAEAEFEKLAAANPKSSVARNLLESVRRKRTATSQAP